MIGLNFNNHVNILCTKANSKIKAPFQLRNTLGHDQKLILYNSFIMSVFSYCPVVWMFCGKPMNDKVNSIQKRAIQDLYNNFELSFQELLMKVNHLTTHTLNKRHLLVEVYRCIHEETSSFLSDIFKPLERNFNLRINNILALPQTSTMTWRLHSITYRGSRSWNSLPDNIKSSPSTHKFKQCMKNTDQIQCLCKLCIRK